MVIEVRKRQRETNRGFLRRFSRRIQQSRVLIRARKRRFRKKAESKRQRRESTLRRIKMAKENEKLRKMGLLQEEPKWKRRRPH